MGTRSIAFPDATGVLTDGVVTLRGPVPDADAAYRFTVETAGEAIGEVTLRPAVPGTAEISYLLADSHRGRGLMSRALRLTLTWGFSEAGFDVVHWRAAIGNWAARRSAWAVGFRMVTGTVPGLVEPGRLTDDDQGAGGAGWLATLRRGDRLTPAHPWFEPERIVGATVVLRAYTEKDLPRMAEACRDPDTVYWLPELPSAYGEAEARQHLDQLRVEQASGQAVYWAVADRDDDRLLAELGLFVRGALDPQGEIGYWAHPDARGRGVTTEAVRLAVRHALLPIEDGGLGLPRVVLRAADGNTASIRVAEKAGFTWSGRDRAADRRRDGARVDLLRFDLLPHELPAVR